MMFEKQEGLLEKRPNDQHRGNPGAVNDDGYLERLAEKIVVKILEELAIENERTGRAGSNRGGSI
jgi:hypothetical protein